MSTLYEKYGGAPTVGALVADFYDRVLQSDVVAHYFVNVEMTRLIDHQTAFLSAVLGGPSLYRGRNMVDAHAGLGITDAEFAEVAAILQDTLEDNGVDPEDIESILASVAALKSAIVVGE